MYLKEIAQGEQLTLVKWSSPLALVLNNEFCPFMVPTINIFFQIQGFFIFLR